MNDRNRVDVDDRTARARLLRGIASGVLVTIGVAAATYSAIGWFGASRSWWSGAAISLACAIALHTIASTNREEDPRG